MSLPLFFFCNNPADREKQSLGSTHFDVFSHRLCIDLAQLPLQSSASWRILRFPI